MVFATNNPHKLDEARHILAPSIRLLSLHDIGCFDELPETHDTLEENAAEKAAYVFSRFGVNCFSEDTGLEVDALHGAPGAYSARYAGGEKSSRDNIRLLLERMKHATDRNARFRTVIALMLDGSKHFFEGTVSGTILTHPAGSGGFGYDPVFVPDGFRQSFAQMSAEQKNNISHRREALHKLSRFLHDISA